MGNCLLGDATTRQINRKMRNGLQEDEELIKLLFLGAGGSGKSTLFKQLKMLHGNALKEAEERAHYRSNIYRNLVDGMKTLLEGNAMLLEDTDQKVGTTIKFTTEEPETVESKSEMLACEESLALYIESLDEAAPMTKEVAEYFKSAWEDPGMQETWRRRSVLQLQDSLKYFIENIDRIATNGYVPSVDDVMHVRIKTTGIVEESLTMEGRAFEIVDVGGQRSERRKWMNCFSDVTGLVFVASLTAYNQFLYEDETVNRLKESLTLFHKLLNESDTFDDACVILFLNKADLFGEMIKTTPITKCLKSYTGPLTEDDQCDFIQSLYEERAGAHKIFTHVTCATNSDQIEIIFKAVNHTLINRALIDAGLLAPLS